MSIQYLHIDYTPSSGWVLQIMARLLKSPDERLRAAFDQWSDTPLKELGFAITTRMHMLGRCLLRLNARVAELRSELTSDIAKTDVCISRGQAFKLRNHELAYELLLDMDSFVFETRSLYEIMGKFLTQLFQALFGHTVTESELQSILSRAGIDTRWIVELRENRKLFFHETAPWLAVQVQQENSVFDPIFLKKQTTTFDLDEFVSFATLRDIYEGFIRSTSELHRYIMEQIRLHELKSPAP
jgi:hypothetical protein